AGAGGVSPDRLAGQPVQVGVARRDVREQVGHADHGAVEVVVVKADGAEHGPIGSAADAAGSEQTTTRRRGHSQISQAIATCKMQIANLKSAAYSGFR